MRFLAVHKPSTRRLNNFWPPAVLYQNVPFSRSIRDVSDGVILLQRYMNEITYKNDYRLQPNAAEKIANRNAGADDGSRRKVSF